MAILRELSSFVDDLLEECSRQRLSIQGTLGRFLPAVAERLGAIGALVRTRNEQLIDEIVEHGLWRSEDKEILNRSALEMIARSPDGRRTIVAQNLIVAGRHVGIAAFSFLGNRLGEAKKLAGRIDVACEELDGVLSAHQTAAVKQQVILRIQQALRSPVFERGVDDAVAELSQALSLRDLVLVYRDETGGAAAARAPRYRIYSESICLHSSDTRPHGRLAELLETGRPIDDADGIRKVLGISVPVETVLMGGVFADRPLGAVLATAAEGLTSFGVDLLTVFAQTVSQRLVDYNRERRHLSQFFAPDVVNELLRDPAYAERYLAPRTEEVALLYADINGFTKISERVLLEPARIGAFVDRWSKGAVEILWKHGGVFDKMVGDCVIGIFGPPFFRADRGQRIGSAVKAARDILNFTVALQDEPEMKEIVSSGAVPGLGVAVALNLCPASVGLFGPNQDFTAFSSGMNATARLQSLAGFREVLLMDVARYALPPADPDLRDVTFEGPVETPVKNVAKPLRFHRIRFAKAK